MQLKTPFFFRINKTWEEASLKILIIFLGWYTSGNERPMKLRGAFNPRIQILLGGLMILVAAAFVILMAPNGSGKPTENALRTDYIVMPIFLILGLGVGLGIGKLRLQALRNVLPEVDGQLFFSEGSVLRKTRDGANAISLQRFGFIIAFLIVFGLSTYTNGKILLISSMAAYVLGQYLAGQTLPFVRLFYELKKKRAASGMP
jgi:hypothetical protein